MSKMGEDPEKRFQSIMDKLFQSSPPSSRKSRGTKRPHADSAFSPPESCRPWDRGDLMRRVATFKSMTWFAKPKVVSVVNCARKGWINVDMDILACESCGAHLLFSTPSSWGQEQVEKAALVFSLKLDSGHKSLCPWINNACDERLAEFPPCTPPMLVEKFTERSCALLQLSALPMISSSAVEHMGSPQLEQFLRQTPVLHNKTEAADMPAIKMLGIEPDAEGSANLYYQAQKLISLCGWEPRQLPYVVDCKDGPVQLNKDAEILNPSHVVSDGQNRSISFLSAVNGENIETNEHCSALSGPQSDPSSVVLDCKLCGASVGLWTFHTIPRPAELFRLVGYSEVNSKQTSGDGDVNSAKDDASVSKDNSSNLKLTIAGGPPPTKQNFKATISLPIVGRDLRARLFCDSLFRDLTNNNLENTPSGSEDRTHFLEKNNSSGSDVSEQLCGKTSDKGQCSHTSNGQLSSSDGKVNETALGKENDNHISSKGMDVNGKENVSETCLIECSSRADIVPDSTKSVQDIVENIGSAVAAVSCEIDSQKDETSGIQNKLVSQAYNNKSSRDGLQNHVNTEIVAYNAGNEGKQPSLDKAKEFDPIRQHRHFCPWIVSTGGGDPGWLRTLSALLHPKESSPLSKSPPSTSLIKVDDPITSVRMLFMSPSSAKRTKTISGSGRSNKYS